MIFIIVCISLNNKKCFDTIDVWCKHEDQAEIFKIQFLKSSWKPVLITEIHTNIKYFKTFPLLAQ